MAEDKGSLIRQIPLFSSLHNDEIGFVGDILHEIHEKERLGEIARANRDGSAQSFCERLWAELTAYRGTSVQFDDVALVAIRAEE